MVCVGCVCGFGLVSAGKQRPPNTMYTMASMYTIIALVREAGCVERSHRNVPFQTVIKSLRGFVIVSP